MHEALVAPRGEVRRIERHRFEQGTRLTERRIPLVECRVHHARPVDVPALRDEVLVHTLQRVGERDMLAVAVDGGSPEWCAQPHRPLPRDALRILPLEAVAAPKQVAPIDVGHAIVIASVHSIRVGDADLRRRADVSLHA